MNMAMVERALDLDLCMRNEEYDKHNVTVLEFPKREKKSKVRQRTHSDRNHGTDKWLLKEAAFNKPSS